MEHGVLPSFCQLSMHANGLTQLFSSNTTSVLHLRKITVNYA